MLGGKGGADPCTSLLGSGQTVGYFADLSTQGTEEAPIVKAVACHSHLVSAHIAGSVLSFQALGQVV